MAFQVSNIPKELLENFKDKSAAFFIGAGLSMNVGFPSWKSLLKAMIEEAKQTPWISADKIQEYEILIDDNSKFLVLAEDLKTELQSKFSDVLYKEFVEHNKSPDKNHELIVSTKSSIIITINYDDLIEQAYYKIHTKRPTVIDYTQSKQAANNFWKGRFFILKAHGDAHTDVETLILTQRDYRKTLYREAGYRSLLQAIFTTKSILFLGVSMNDPEFNQLLDYLHESYHGGGPTHYLLIDEKINMKTMAKRYLEDFKIHTITYNNDNKDYAEITEFLEILHNEAPL